MSESNGGLRALWLAAIVALSVVAGTVALSGAAAAATNVSISPDDPAAGASGVEYTAEGDVELSQQKSLQHVDVDLGPADLSNVGVDDVTVIVNDNTAVENGDGATGFEKSDGVVEFKLESSVDGISDGENVEVRVSSVTNPDDDFEARVVLNDSSDNQWQEFTDTVEIDTEPSITYSDLDFDDGTENSTNTTVNANEDLNVSATVENTGEQAGTYNASLKVDGAVQQWNNGTIEANEELTTTFETNFSETGTYDVTISDLSSTEVTVTESLEIVDYAEREDVDLIVMGRVGAGGAEIPHVGSVTDRVLRMTDIPVFPV